MTRRTIASENKVGGGSKFPKLEFKNKGEYHRVLLFQKDEAGQAYVWQEYVHVLRVPKFKADGTPKMVLKESRRGEDGDKYEDYDTDWLGSPLCLGRTELPNPADPANPLPGPLLTDGYDAQACPICEAVPNAPAEAKLLPQLNFAINVVEYSLASGSWQVQRPLSARVVIWKLNTSTFDDIISQQDQHGELLQKQDLTLEVVNPGFRTVKMGVMAPSGWADSPNGAAYLGELLSTPGNIATDEQLRAACGREAKRIFMQEDLGTCLKKWRKAKQVLDGAEDPAGNAALGGGQQPGLAQGVSELLNGAQPDPAETAQQVAQLRDQTKAEVTGILNPGPFSEFTADNSQAAADQQHAQVMSSQSPAGDPFGAVSAQNGTPQAAASEPAASTPSAPLSDPFSAAGSTPAGSPSAPSPAVSQAAPAAPVTIPTAPQHSDPFATAAQQSAAVAAPTTAPSAESPSAPPQSGKTVSFEDMIQSLEQK